MLLQTNASYASFPWTMPTVEPMPLENELRGMTREGELYEKLPNDRVRCFACGHRCLILDGQAGVCRVRFNRDGTLHVPSGYAGVLQFDPIEKKPFFHAHPGTNAFSFGMLGCDFHCGYCQNWVTSQTLRDPAAGVDPKRLTAEEMVALAKRYGASTLASTYNEPLITSEWAVEIFKLAKAAGIHTAYISNGNATPEVLDYLLPWLELYKVDLKSFNDANYRKLGGKLDNVLQSIQQIHQKGLWLEIVTLIVPGFNDSDEELGNIAHFLADISGDIPWHVTAFHQDYKMRDRENTAVATLMRAANLGREAGLRFVYAGNLPGQVGHFENTHCPDCSTLLVKRSGYRILAYNMRAGACPQCQRTIPGRWPKDDVVPLAASQPRPIQALRYDRARPQT